VTAHINPAAPYKAPAIAEEDNSDTDRDRGVPRQSTAPTPPIPSVSKPPLPQLAETVQPVSLCNEEYSREQADRVERAYRTREPIEEPPIADCFGAFSDAGDNGSVRPTSPLTDHSLDPNSGDELGEEDYINWAVHNADNRSVNDGDDGSGDKQTRQAECTAEDPSDDVGPEQYTKAAAARLKMAWDKRCSCSM
jgi:hypothetical protein